MLALNTLPKHAPAAYQPELDAPDLDTAIAAAETKIPPLWTLRNFVAVNAWLGFTEQPFTHALYEIQRLYHARGVMPLAWYEAAAEAGRIDDIDLEMATQELAEISGHPMTTVQALAQHRATPVLTYSEVVDRQLGTRWHDLIGEEITKYCAARFDVGQAAWQLPWQGLGIWQAWQAMNQHDRSLEIRGLAGLRRYVAGLPDTPRAAIEVILNQLDVPQRHWTRYLTRALTSIAGWAGHIQYHHHEARLHGQTPDDALVHLLAIRLTYDGALDNSLRPGQPALAEWQDKAGFDETDPQAKEPTAEMLWQYAFEHRFRQTLLNQLTQAPARPAPVPAPTLQAVFCIDVRSEILRRHLEAISPQIQTIGFAGFFGFSFEMARIGDQIGTARCPVLLTPGFKVQETAAAHAHCSHEKIADAREFEVTKHRAFLSLRLSSISAYSFAETVGPYFGLRLLTDSLQVTRPHADGALLPSTVNPKLAPTIEVSEREGERLGLTVDQRIELAAGALHNMGLTDNFAEIVLICGHGSTTTNNPYAAGLDCGACGGHAGDTNARVAAAVLNDPAVRQGLAERGIMIPEPTRFVAGRHDTTTDEVTLYDTDDLPEQPLETIRDWLAEAGEQARGERLPSLTRGEPPRTDATREVRRRSRDWSEVRPEWGLARNAAFIAARRARTAGLDLQGRVFLHDYDHARDSDGSVLELIMTAPLVVAHWINMQYYVSTVDNEVFGSGNKVLHNIVSRHGVMLGNRSDLQVGLPWQSVHDGERFYHEPIRLHAILEAPTAAIDAVLAKHADVRQLVDNGWLHLMAWDPDSNTIRRRSVLGDWRRQPGS